MSLRLFNTFTRKKEIFRPARKGEVKFYACGPTVYDYVHVGNLRTFIFEDILRRTLELNGHKVKLVMNITDIDDKTIRGAKKAGKSLKEFTSFYEKGFFGDIKRLNILPAFKYPRATEHISEMKKIINLLLKKKYAYETEDGIYFDISKFKKYGRLSGLKQKEPARPAGGLKSGARISVDEYSKDQAEDFALWKKKSPPVGGHPGWHIECSAMSIKYLGLPIDIHAGGIDLIFPHHENEIAQSEAAYGIKFARFFVEGEHLLIEKKKMSKSLGNLFTLRDLETKGFEPLDFRYLVLTAHYRSPLSFSWKALEGARQARLKLQERAREAKARKKKSDGSFCKEFLARLNDDLNMPRALALLWKEAKSYEDLLCADEVLGLGLKNLKKAAVPPRVKALLVKREALRREKKWGQADRIREEIMKLGFKVQDMPEGSQVIKI